MEVYIRNIGLHMFDLILAQAIHSLLHASASNDGDGGSGVTPRRHRRHRLRRLCFRFCRLLSAYASLDGNAGGVTPKARAERCDRVRTFSRPPTAGWLSAIRELMCNVHIARMSWAPNPINYILIVLLCIDSPISCNICVFEVYKGHMG